MHIDSNLRNEQEVVYKKIYKIIFLFSALSCNVICPKKKLLCVNLKVGISIYLFIFFPPLYQKL